MSAPFVFGFFLGETPCPLAKGFGFDLQRAKVKTFNHRGHRVTQRTKLSKKMHQLPQQPLRAFHLNFGPDWSKGIVSVEPPEIGKPFVVRVPAVDADGNVRAGIRLPDIAVPLATHAGWNYRDASIGAPDRLAGEIGSYIPFSRTKADRERAGDPRASIDERYRNRDEYVGKFAASALELVGRGYLLQDDVADLLKHAIEHYDWATRTVSTRKN